MGQQQKIATITYLQDILYSEEDIVKSVEEREHIFEITGETEASFGYVSLYDLKTYVHLHEEESRHFKIRNIDSDEWVMIYEHPYFQRRKPQLVSTETLSDDDDHQFFVLRNGQKIGPYQKYELISMVEEKEILLTDMVSSNAGHTWMKLYQVDGFDRRSLKESDQLPGMPSQVISREQEHVLAMSPETEAISGLAYLSNVRRGKSVEREKVETVYKAEPTTKGRTSTVYKWLLVVSLVGIGYFLFHIKNQLTSPFTSQGVKTVGEQAEMLEPVDTNAPMAPSTNPSARSQLGERKNYNQINDQRRSGGKTLEPIRPNQRKSFMDSAKFQEINAAGEEDPNYYYDNTSAMELDPVRSQVSKENYDNSAAEAEGPIPSSDQLFESEVSH